MRPVIFWGTLLGVLAVAGCVGSETQQCTWGRVCPTDKYCEESVGLCLYASQAEVCPSVQDASPLRECTFSDAPPGSYACQGGLCLRSICGDGKLGPREACDDGNTVGGDKCSADCLSEEGCGNGQLDVLAGEACDDGNLVSHDGCSSGCTDESVYHTLLAASLPERFGAAAAYDPIRQKTVIFSGFTPEPLVLEDTWEYDGDIYRELFLSFWPWGRQDASLTYLPSRQQVVLFAGWSGNASLDDLWEFNGVVWTAIQTNNGPPARSAHAAAYDPGRDRLVIFGGETGSRVPYDDLWELDGSAWSRITLDATPPARRYGALAYDESLGRLVLFGGSQGTSAWVYLSDTWEYDGSAWTEMTPAVSPDPRHGHQMGWDPVADRLVLFGGMGNSGGMDDTWVYQNGEWIWLDTPTSPPPRGQFLMTHDAVRDSLVVQSGHAGNYACYSDAWTLVGDSWEQFASPGPKARVSAGMTFDAGRGVSVMFGGETYFNSEEYFGDTWKLSGSVWRLVSPSASPSARTYSPLVYDTRRENVVLFGGCSGVSCNDAYGDTWIFDGTTWIELNPGNGPPGRALHAMTYDASTHEVVLFGGRGASGLRGDTWRFDGDLWRQVTGLPAPSPRSFSTMAYDAYRDVVVLFGGYSASGEYLRDTWELGVNGWREMSPAVFPQGRIGHRLVYHAGRRRVQLLGGTSESEAFVDMWEYDGSTWSFVALPLGVPWRTESGVVYNDWAGEVVQFGGGTEYDAASSETWAYRYGSNWPDEICFGQADEDGDGLTDCEDLDCDGRTCDTAKVCVDGACL